MPKFAANLSMMFTEWDFLDRFAAAADAGFTAVEYLFPYDFDPEDIAKRLRQNRLRQALFNLPPGNFAAGDRGLAALPKRQEEFRYSFTKVLPYVQMTGVPRVHLMSGNAPSGDAAAMAAYRDSITFACREMAKLGVDVMIEPINPRDMPGYFLNSFATAVALIEDLRLPNLKLQYDVYHRQILHGDVMKSLDALMPLIGHVQIASVPKRHEPGTGELNDDAIFAHLDGLGYGGFVGCEYRPAAGTLAGLSWFKNWR